MFTSTETTYLLKDPLGSIMAFMDESGQVVQDMSFEPFGARRNANSWASFGTNYLPDFDVSKSTRGFTGHEMVDRSESST